MARCGGAGGRLEADRTPACAGAIYYRGLWWILGVCKHKRIPPLVVLFACHAQNAEMWQQHHAPVTSTA